MRDIDIVAVAVFRVGFAEDSAAQARAKRQRRMRPLAVVKEVKAVVEVADVERHRGHDDDDYGLGRGGGDLVDERLLRRAER